MMVNGEQFYGNMRNNKEDGHVRHRIQVNQRRRKSIGVSNERKRDGERGERVGTTAS